MSVTRTAVKKHGHQHIMGSAVLKKSVEDLLAHERVVRCIGWLGYRDIMLKSGAESAIIALRSRVAEGCRAEPIRKDGTFRKRSVQVLERARCSDTILRDGMASRRIKNFFRSVRKYWQDKSQLIHGIESISATCSACGREQQTTVQNVFLGTAE